MGSHEGKDDIAFFHAAIERTYELSATVGGAQLSDAEGALPEGRYLIQVVNQTPPAALCWIHVGAFEVGVSLSLVAGAGGDRIPLGSSVVAIETNVVRGDSDRIGAIMSAGTATVFITRISRTAARRS